MKVVLADDHRMMRDGLRAVLERAGVEVVGEASNGHEAIAEVKRLRPGILVIDIAMPELNGIDATRRLSAELPGIKVIALTMNSDRRYVIAMLEAGAAGYLLKNAASDELLTALAVVARGQTYLSPAIAGGVVDLAIGRGPAPRYGADSPLSVREREVLQLLAEGKSSKEIATVLQIAVPTVETHRRQIMDKLSLRTIAELTKYAIREGLTSAEP
ncbi:MAG TPA: response regulator transcription factor [Polyangiaceae bacterium]|nr:response regulator transcription factor [Polyangiaceae bacterium]